MPLGAGMPVILEKAKVLAVIEEVITPYVGSMMARSSIQLHCDKLGIVSGQMTVEEKNKLLEQLSKGMSVFAGREKAVTLTQEIESRIGSGGKR